MTIRKALSNLDHNRAELSAPVSTPDIKKAKASQSTHVCPLQVSGYDPEYSFCSIREPLSWYASIYRNKVIGEKTFYINAWKPIFSFEHFVNEVLTIHPYGYVTRLYASFVPFVHRTIRTEYINIELPKLLKSWGLEIKKPIERRNTGKHADITLSEGLKKALLQIESGAVNLYEQVCRGGI